VVEFFSADATATAFPRADQCPLAAGTAAFNGCPPRSTPPSSAIPPSPAQARSTKSASRTPTSRSSVRSRIVRRAFSLAMRQGLRRDPRRLHAGPGSRRPTPPAASASASTRQVAAHRTDRRRLIAGSEVGTVASGDLVSKYLQVIVKSVKLSLGESIWSVVKQKVNHDTNDEVIGQLARRWPHSTASAFRVGLAEGVREARTLKIGHAHRPESGPRLLEKNWK